MLGESAIAVRTKAMKCLSEVVAVDPSILARVNHPVFAAVHAITFSNVNLCLTNLPSLFFSWICSVGFIVASWTTPPVSERQPWSSLAGLCSVDRS